MYQNELYQKYFPLLESLDESTTPLWGTMNSQQMLEHLALTLQLSLGKIPIKQIVPEEKVERAQAFLFTDKPLPRNVPLPVEKEKIPASICKDFGEAKAFLAKAIQDFFDFQAANEGIETLHPAFGMLNREKWILFHHKHFTHHFTQFGLIPA